MKTIITATKSGNFTHLSTNGTKTLCGRETGRVIENSSYVSCHRCSKYAK